MGHCSNKTITLQNGETVKKNISGSTFTNINAYATGGNAVISAVYANGNTSNLCFRYDGSVMLTRYKDGAWISEVELAPKW